MGWLRQRFFFVLLFVSSYDEPRRLYDKYDGTITAVVEVYAELQHGNYSKYVVVESLPTYIPHSSIAVRAYNPLGTAHEECIFLVSYSVRSRPVFHRYAQQAYEKFFFFARLRKQNCRENCSRQFQRHSMEELYIQATALLRAYNKPLTRKT